MARNYYLRKRVMVTGGAGFLGSHLIDRLLKDGCDVLCVDNLFTGNKENIAHLRDQLHCIGQNRQCGQAEKVHLQQAHLFDGDHVEGGDDFVVLRLVQRNQISQRLRRNHHSSRMHAGVAGAVCRQRQATMRMRVHQHRDLRVHPGPDPEQPEGMRG